MGNALIARLLFSLKKNNIPIWFDATTQDLIYKDNTVVGVKVTMNGNERLITASKGVVLATGGYGHHAKFRELCMPEPSPEESMVCPSVT